MSPKIALRPNLASEFQMYAREVGITLDSAVNDALNQWMENIGRFAYADLVKRRKATTTTTGRSLRLVKGNSAIAS